MKTSLLFTAVTTLWLTLAASYACGQEIEAPPEAADPSAAEPEEQAEATESDSPPQPQEQTQPEEPQDQPQQPQDQPEAQPPLREEDEEEQDSRHAAELLAEGRTLHEQGDLEAALRHYQRSWRWDPSAELLEEIVPLTFSLNRPDEAVRYALLSADEGGADPPLLRRLAVYLTEQGEWLRAASLYRRWLETVDPSQLAVQRDRLLVLLEVGRLEFLSGQTDSASAALAEFQAALAPRRGAPSGIAATIRQALGDELNGTWELCGLVHLAAERWDLAAQAFDQLEVGLEGESRKAYLLARAAYGQGDWLTAWDYLRQYYRAPTDKQNAEPYRLLGKVFSRLNQPELAARELAGLSGEDPSNTAAAIALAELLQKQGQHPSAMRIYQQVAEQSPGEASLSRIVALERLIAHHAQRRELKSLWDTLLLAARQPRVITQLGEALDSVAADEQLVDQLSELSAISTLASSTSEAVRARALLEVMLAAQRGAEAARWFPATLSGEPAERAQQSVRVALQLLLMEAYGEAAEILQQAHDEELLGADDATLPYYLAAARKLHGETEAALAAARLAAEREPESAEIVSRLPWVLRHADRDGEAITAYRELIAEFDDEHSPGSRDVLRDARVALSNLYIDADDRPQAEEQLERVLDEFPEDYGAMNDLGYLWADQGKHLRMSQRMIEKAVAEEPDNAAYRDSLGWVLYRQGELEAAARELETALELSREEASEAGASQDGAAGDDESEAAEAAAGEPDGVIADHLGDAYAKLGRAEDALQMWELAADVLADEEPERAATIRAKIAQHTPRSADEEEP